MVYRDPTHIDPNKEYQIKELANFIRNKLHGIDVREAMAMALEKVYEDASEGGDANMEVKMARGTEKTLGDRLDKHEDKINDNSSQLAQTEQEITDLNNAKMDKNTTDISVSQINKNKGKLDETYMTDEFLQQMTGNTPIHSVPADKSITTEKLADKAVIPEITSFVRRGKNKFDGIYHNKRLLGSPMTFAEGSISKSAIIKVDPNKDYTISRSVDTDVFAIGTFSDYPQIGDTAIFEWGGANTAGVGSKTISTENAEYLVVYLSTDNEGIEPEFLQVEEGSVVTPYTPSNKVVIDLEDESLDFNVIKKETISVEAEQTNFITKTKNLHKNDFVEGAIGKTPEEFFHLEGTYSLFFEGEKGKTYTISKASNTNRFVIGVNVGRPEYGDLIGRVVNTDNTLTRKTVTLSGEEDYIIVYLSSSTNSQKPDWIQIEEGNIATDYEPPYKLSEEHFGGTTSESIQRIPIITNDARGNYKTATTTYISMADLNNDVNILYSFYDDLVTNHPDYITRTLLGNDEVLDLPIYNYKFAPPTPIHNEGIKNAINPKVIYISGTHGQEKESVLGGLHFFTELANNWQNDELLEMLRWNVEFNVIPSLNPYGFNNHSRTNGNGVDIGRNSAHNWEPNTEEGTRYYAGPYATSEIESQILEQFILDNYDASLAIDHHTYNSYPDNTSHISWFGCIDDSVGQIFRGLSQHLTGMAKKDYPYLNTSNDSLVSIKNTDVMGYRGLPSQTIQDLGVPSILIETVPSFGEVQDDLRQYTTNVVGNTILAGIRYGNLFK